MAKRKLHIKFKKIRAVINDYQLIALIVVLVIILSFGFSLAQNETDPYLQISSDETIFEDDLPVLISDMQFEAKQIKRDIQRLLAEIDVTEQAITPAHLYCEAFEVSRTALKTLVDFDEKMQPSSKREKLTVYSSKKDIYESYELFKKIRGSAQNSGVRSIIYGGYNPLTRHTTAGSIKEMNTCRTIAQTVTKTCKEYDRLKSVSPKGTQLNQYKTLHSSVIGELKTRCTLQLKVLKNAGFTPGDLTAVTQKNGTLCTELKKNGSPTLLSTNGETFGTLYDCKTIIEKYLGADRLLRKLEKGKN